MQQEKPQRTQPHRKPGRPKGTEQYPEDQATLRKIADHRLDRPDATFAFLARELGYTEENHIRRLRGKWHEQGDELFEKAKLQRDAQRDQGLWGDIAYAINQFLDSASQVVESALVERMVKFAHDLNAKVEARRRLGHAPKPPFDVNDPEQILSAFAEFEAREFRTTSDLLQSFPEGQASSELPMSTRYYVGALFCYQRSLDALEAEQAGHTDSSETDEVSK